MEAIIKWLVVGYFTGFVCITYLIGRTLILEKASTGEHTIDFRDEHLNGNWLGMTLLSVIISLGWSFIAAGIYFVLDSDLLFTKLSLLIAAVVTLIGLAFKKSNKVDIIALNTIVIVGLGFLIPVVF